MNKLPEETVREIEEFALSHWKYDPETGVLTGRGGKPVGRVGKAGALGLWAKVPDGRRFHVLVHRVAWFMQTGVWPKRQIDHRDGNESNNRWDNLREATQLQNSQNLRPRSKTGRLLGTRKARNGWDASINVPGEARSVYLGRFTTEQEAHEAYCEAKLRLHTFNPVQRKA